MTGDSSQVRAVSLLVVYSACSCKSACTGAEAKLHPAMDLPFGGLQVHQICRPPKGRSLPPDAEQVMRTASTSHPSSMHMTEPQ